MTRSMAAGCGCTYEQISGDLSQVNYSSARLGALDFRRRVNAFQRNQLVNRLLDRVWTRLLLLEALSGRLSMAVAQVKCEFTFPAFAQIDPLKETEADIRAVEGRIRSRAEVISARGRDPQDVDREIAQDILAESRNIARVYKDEAT